MLFVSKKNDIYKVYVNSEFHFLITNLVEGEKESDEAR